VDMRSILLKYIWLSVSFLAFLQEKGTIQEEVNNSMLADFMDTTLFHRHRIWSVTENVSENQKSSGATDTVFTHGFDSIWFVVTTDGFFILRRSSWQGLKSEAMILGQLWHREQLSFSYSGRNFN